MFDPWNTKNKRKLKLLARELFTKHSFVGSVLPMNVK